MNRLGLILILVTFCTLIHAQTITVNKAIETNLIKPIYKATRVPFRKFTNSLDDCKTLFCSVKFIVNADYRCDSIIYSKSVFNELKDSISSNLNKVDIPWKEILNGLSPDSQTHTYTVIVPFSLSREKCSVSKLNDAEIWNVFNEIMYLNNKTITQPIIISPSKIFMSH